MDQKKKIRLSDIAEKATQKDTVIVSNELEIIMWMPMRYLSDAPVYPQLGDLAGQANDILSNSEGDVYVISSKTLNYDVYNWELVYSDDELPQMLEVFMSKQVGCTPT